MTERDVPAANALERVAALGGHFTVAVRDHPPPEGGWRQVTGLYDPATDALRDLVDRTAGRLGTDDHRVAASILHQGYAARLWSVVLGCTAATGLVPILNPADTYWRSTEQSLVELLTVTPSATPVGEGPLDRTARLVAAGALDAHVEPLATAVRTATGVSALVGTLRVLAPHGLGRMPTDIARVLFGTPALRDGGTVDLAAEPPVLRRGSCCLFYRVPGGGLCGDCVLQA
ncbi:MAG: ferric iron reductase [Streptosporangiales bacterium]|nr:ferric iron reductase [Streptosporangiales bacterium]